jgi:hypothetical protein
MALNDTKLETNGIKFETTDNKLLNAFIRHVEFSKKEELSESAMETYNLIYAAICDAIKNQCKEFKVEITLNLDTNHKNSISDTINSTQDMLEANGWHPYMHRTNRFGGLKLIFSCEFKNYRFPEGRALK